VISLRPAPTTLFASAAGLSGGSRRDDYMKIDLSLTLSLSLSFTAHVLDLYLDLLQVDLTPTRSDTSSPALLSSQYRVVRQQPIPRSGAFRNARNLKRGCGTVTRIEIDLAPVVDKEVHRQSGHISPTHFTPSLHTGVVHIHCETGQPPVQQPAASQQSHQPLHLVPPLSSFVLLLPHSHQVQLA
jgi:hypothetical protein